MRNPTLRLYVKALVISSVFVILVELVVKHHSNKLSTQVGAGVLVWLSIANAGALGALWTRGGRPAGWARVFLSLAVSLDLWVPVVLYRRHPSTRPVSSRVIGTAIIVLLSAALIWATIWGAMWLVQRARPAGAGRRKVLGVWVTSLAVAGAFSMIGALRNSGFDSRHVVLLVGISLFVWLATALALRVLIALVFSRRGRNRPARLST